MIIRNNAGDVTNYKIDGCKYYSAATSWRCTTNCNGSLEVRGNRYRVMNPHKCDAGAKQAEEDKEKKRRSNAQ